MSTRDTAAALVIATAAVGVFALAAKGQPGALGPDPYAAGPVEIAGAVKSVEDDSFVLEDAQGREFRVETDAAEDPPRDDEGDLDLDPGERVRVEGFAGAPLLDVNMIAALRLTLA